MSQQLHNAEKQSTDEHGTYASYIIGFVSSVILTLLAFGLVFYQLLSGPLLIAAIFGLALVQLYVQLAFFLHLSFRPKSRSNMFIFILMTVIVLIVVVGTIWIMNNLNYNMMTEHETIEYMNDNQGF